MWFSTFSCKCIRSKLIDLSLALARSLTVLLFLNLPLWSLSIVTSFSNSEPLLTSLNICICEVSFIASVWVHFLLSQTNSSSENNSVCYPVLLSAHLVTCTTCKELETLYLAFSISQLKPTHWEFLVIRDISNFQVSVPCLPQPKEKKIVELKNEAPFAELVSDSQEHLLTFLSGQNTAEPQCQWVTAKTKIHQFLYTFPCKLWYLSKITSNV